MHLRIMMSVAVTLSLAGLVRGEPDAALETYARGDYAGAIKLLEPGFAAGKLNLQQRLLLGRAYLHLDRPDDALKAFRSVLAADGENPEANSLAGRVLLDKGRHAEAIKCLEHADRLKQDPATAAALGRCYHATGELSKAKTYLAKALEQDIRDPANSLLLGRICLSRGSGALAQHYLLMALEAGEDSVELHRCLGNAYLLQRKFVGPILVRRVPGEPKAGQFVDGCVVLGPAAAMGPDVASGPARGGGGKTRVDKPTVARGAGGGFVDAGLGLHRVGTRYSALYEGLWLLAKRPTMPDALYMAAVGWLAAGDTDRAARHLETLLRHEPDSRRAAELQARVSLAREEFATLDRCLATGLAAKRFDPPMVADFYYRAALVRRAQGRRDQAVALLGKAEAITPADEKVLRALASLHRVAGHRAAAQRYYARLVELFPDAPDIDELRNNAKVLAEPTGGRS